MILGYEDNEIKKWSHVHVLMLQYVIDTMVLLCKKYVEKRECSTTKYSCLATLTLFVICKFFMRGTIWY